MVTKEYKCGSCKEFFELTVKMDADASTCPLCGGADILRVFLTPISIKGASTRDIDGLADKLLKEEDPRPKTRTAGTEMWEPPKEVMGTMFGEKATAKDVISRLEPQENPLKRADVKALMRANRTRTIIERGD